MAELTVKKDEDDEQRPPSNEEETALVWVIGYDNYHVAEHTGPYFFSQIVEAGMQGEEIGIDNVPEEPGCWIMEKGKVTSSRDWETGIVDDCYISGEWRKATVDDLVKYPNAEVPLALLVGATRTRDQLAGIIQQALAAYVDENPEPGEAYQLLEAGDQAARRAAGEPGYA